VPNNFELKKKTTDLRRALKFCPKENGLWVHIFLETADFLEVAAFRFGTFAHTNILLYETQIKLWEVVVVIAGLYCISTPMKMCHLVHGLLVLKLSTLMTAICAVGPHQVLL
jgi:hypothetical protein